MKKVFLQNILPILIAVCVLILIIFFYQSNYSKIIFERQIPIEYLYSSSLKLFLNATGAKTCRCFVTKAHPHRPFYLLYLMVEANNPNVIQNFKNCLVKSPRTNTDNLAALQKIGAVNKKSTVSDYILVGEEQPFYIYSSERTLIICFPAQDAQSVNKAIGSVLVDE